MLKAMVARALTGEMTPRQLTTWTHSTFGHYQLPLAETLAVLDDDYDIRDDSTLGNGDLDAQVLAEARRILNAPT